MEKFTELEKGTLVKYGKEFDYVIEIAEDFDTKKVGNVRSKIIEERPLIKKIRTRYDPDITLYGDKSASMELMLGYDMKEIKKSLRDLLFTLIGPFYFMGMIILMINIGKIPSNWVPHWLMWILVPGIIALSVVMLRMYYKMNMTMLAEYLKARDLRKILKTDGFRQ